MESRSQSQIIIFNNEREREREFFLFIKWLLILFSFCCLNWEWTIEKNLIQSIMNRRLKSKWCDRLVPQNRAQKKTKTMIYTNDKYLSSIERSIIINALFSSHPTSLSYRSLVVNNIVIVFHLFQLLNRWHWKKQAIIYRKLNVIL
jgi:hypothetical protein